MYLHTALRKNCNSKITSAAYNLIHLICDSLKAKHSPWHLLGKLVAERLNEGDKPLGAMKLCVDRLDAAYLDRVCLKRREKGKEVYPKDAYQWLHALRCTLQCFDESDWVGMVTLLESEMDDA